MPEEEKSGYYFEENTLKDVEKFVGIDAYSTSTIESISGIFKHSFKDFIVKEILSTGEVLEIKEDRRPQSFSEKLRDKYTTFNLVKVNMDTFAALRNVGKALKISANRFHYSGLKDRCAISVQKVSIKGNFVEALKKLRLRDIFIRSISSTKNPVKLGGNKGNHFTVVIRNIENKSNLKDLIDHLFVTLKQQGFLNVFGVQRFGQYRPNSHNVGRYLLEGNYKKAFNEYVSKVYSTESAHLQQIRGSIKNEKDFENAYKIFPISLYYERALIKHMLDHPGDYKGSFDVIQQDLKTLFMSAFQSYLFNKMISLRFKKGISLIKPVKGDVISILDDENGHITQIKYIYGALNGMYDKYLDKAIKLNRAVIIIPIIGYNTNLDDFPLMKSIFEDIAQQDGINPNIFRNELLYQFEFKGAFRAMTTKPIGLKFIELAEDDLFPGNKKLKFEFSLNKGSYATLVIRELIKNSN